MNSDQHTSSSFKNWLKISAILIILFAMLMGGYIFYTNWKQSKQIISPNIAKQLTFPIFWPKSSNIFIADKSSIQYQASSSLLTFTATNNSGTKLTFSEQGTPESFNDVPQAYDSLIESLVQYSTFDSVNGKVYLTRPKELRGGQSAAMNAKGTLMFIKPDKNLSDDEWKKLFNDLDVIK